MNRLAVTLVAFACLAGQATLASAGDREKAIAARCAAESGGEPLAWAACAGEKLALQEVGNLFSGKAFGCGHEVRKLLDRGCRKKDKPSKPPFLFAMPYKDGYITGYRSGGDSLYYSPDGENLRGGGSTRLVYSGKQRVRAIVPWRGGVMTAFTQGGIYWSPNGYNLGGKGKTRRRYASQPVRSMRVVNGKLETCFTSACYCSATGKFPGGGKGTTGGRCPR